MVTRDTSDLQSTWVCQKCQSEMPSSEVIGLENKIANQLKDALTLTIGHLEEELSEMAKILHPNHYLMLLVNKHLISSYGIDLQKQTMETLKKRESLCLQVRIFRFHPSWYKVIILVYFS